MKTLSNAACLSEILDRLSHVRADSPRKWGKMNAHQMICHLADSLRGMMGRKQVSPVERPFGPVMKWAALSLPMKWPKGVPTRPEVDQQISGTEPAEFEADLRELIFLTQEFARFARQSTFSPHPMFGQMTGKEWMRWCYLHHDHHLRQFGC